ncbi:MAG: hypothetical protein HWN80_11745 [Candidatus Lokiarchaeota archaeon]|nr:hypothetical protein [Candidatus Lokiarchaeota archaeon]
MADTPYTKNSYGLKFYLPLFIILLIIITEGYENDRIWYSSHGSAEDRWQNEYNNIYYEMKEKFEKEYLNKGKDNKRD